MKAELVKQLQAEAAGSPRREICGLISSAGVLYPIENVPRNATDFVFSKRGYYEALQAIRERGAAVACVYHSHLHGDPAPSAQDLAAMSRLGMDYLIVTPQAHTYTEYRQCREI